MPESDVLDATPVDVSAPEPVEPTEPADHIGVDSLIEDVSIDGMCGVY
ncbi:MAG: mycofactocin precursor [Streptomycetaceae bacterium]|jgi:mycofactocin precursor|nr:mycofactocin precursor [Streptomycetaceae bacterium]NUS56837.1 mycofactocin precursor [Streptomycetaceae bacterium]